MKICITIDDIPYVFSDPKDAAPDVNTLQDAWLRILRDLKGCSVEATFFVNSDHAIDHSWLLPLLANTGELGNHTASHCDFHAVSFDEWCKDVDRCNRALAPHTAGNTRWFRFPYLKSGASSIEKNRAEIFLAKSNLILVPGACPTCDWLFAFYYDQMLNENDSHDAAVQLRHLVVEHIVRALANSQIEAARHKVQDLPITLVLHASRLLSHVLGDLLEKLRERGCVFASIESTMHAYAKRNLDDLYVGARGGSYYLRLSEAGCKSLNQGTDWLSLEKAMITKQLDRLITSTP